MKNKSTNLKEEIVKDQLPEDTQKPQEIRVIIEPPLPKPAAPKWWDVMGWVLRIVVALATLLKLLKDK